MGVSPCPNGMFGPWLLLAILEVQRHDALVMLVNEIHGIEPRGEEVADIQIHIDIIRVAGHGFLKRLRRREFVGIFGVIDGHEIPP